MTRDADRSGPTALAWATPFAFLQDFTPDRFWAERKLGLAGIGLLYLVILGAYFYQGVSLSLNADDVVQHQSAADALTMVEQGRWGYYLIWRWALDYSPAPGFSTLVGSAVLLVTYLWAAALLQLRSVWAVAAFVLIGAISIYYGDLFEFDSTRVAYPVANLLAVAGLALTLSGRSPLGIVLMAISPAIYPAGAQLAATLLLGVIVLWAVRRDAAPSLGRLLWSGVALVLALALYALGTRAVYGLLGLALGDRGSIDPLALFDHLWALRDLVLRHALPFLNVSGPAYLPPAVVALLALGLLAHGLWLLGGARTRPLWRTGLALLASGAMLVAPFFLIFGNAAVGFPERALYAFSLTHGFWFATLIDTGGDDRWGRAGRTAALAGAALLVAASGFQIAKRAYEARLAYQADILATNRILSRLETAAAAAGLGDRKNLPLAVIFEDRRSAGPRGDVGSARQEPWSKEWIFRLVSQRFRPASAEQIRAAEVAAAARPPWPAAESVFVTSDGVAVVVAARGPLREAAP